MLGRLLLGFRFALSARRRGQGVVEYGLIAASLAFVGAVGFNALAGNEKTYLQNFPKNGPVPAAPGSLLHPTTISGLNCSSPVWPIVPVNDTITCNTPTVTDVFSNPSDLHAPGGVIDYYRDGSVLIPSMRCTLVPVTGSSSSCSSPTVSWRVTDASLADGSARTLTARYDGQTTNHLPANTNSVTFYVEIQLKFTAAAPSFTVSPAAPHPFSDPDNDYCINYDTVANMQPNMVEVGHPLLCTVQVYDQTDSAWYAGKTITWTVNNLAAGPGLVSCTTAAGTNLAPMFTVNACPPSPSLQCTTDANGKCSVVYRRLNTASALSVDALGLQTLTISALNQSVSPTINVQTAALHPAAVLINCGAPKTANVTQAMGPVQLRQAPFTATSGIGVNQPPGSITCTATVIDTDPNTALDCYGGTCVGPNTNPDQHDAYPPIGVIAWTWGGLATPPPTCNLWQIGNFAGYQAPGQTPFASYCQSTLSFTPGPSTSVTASYSGPTHQSTSTSITLDID